MVRVVNIGVGMVLPIFDVRLVAVCQQRCGCGRVSGD